MPEATTVFLTEGGLTIVGPSDGTSTVLRKLNRRVAAELKRLTKDGRYVDQITMNVGQHLPHDAGEYVAASATIWHSPRS